jgi:hypothetical protein
MEWVLRYIRETGDTAEVERVIGRSPPQVGLDLVLKLVLWCVAKILSKHG